MLGAKILALKILDLVHKIQNNYIASLCSQFLKLMIESNFDLCSENNNNNDNNKSSSGSNDRA